MKVIMVNGVKVECSLKEGKVFRVNGMEKAQYKAWYAKKFLPLRASNFEKALKAKDWDKVERAVNLLGEFNKILPWEFYKAHVGQLKASKELEEIRKERKKSSNHFTHFTESRDIGEIKKSLNPKKLGESFEDFLSDVFAKCFDTLDELRLKWKFRRT